MRTLKKIKKVNYIEVACRLSNWEDLVKSHNAMPEYDVQTQTFVDKVNPSIFTEIKVIFDRSTNSYRAIGVCESGETVRVRL